MLIPPAYGGYALLMRRKDIIVMIVIGIMVMAAASLAAFHFTRPAVAFIGYGTFPPGYELPKPHSFFRYRMVGDPAVADLVITAPDAAVPAGVGSYLFGREAEEGEEPIALLPIDAPRMWEEAISDDSAYAILYEETSPASIAIAGHLSSIDPSISLITYHGRISTANIDQIASAIGESGADKVIVLNPDTSMDILRLDHGWDAVMDIRDAAALETVRVEQAVSIDWDSTIESLLSGNAGLSYCLLSL